MPGGAGDLFIFPERSARSTITSPLALCITVPITPYTTLAGASAAASAPIIPGTAGTTILISTTVAVDMALWGVGG